MTGKRRGGGGGTELYSTVGRGSSSILSLCGSEKEEKTGSGREKGRREKKEEQNKMGVCFDQFTEKSGSYTPPHPSHNKILSCCKLLFIFFSLPVKNTPMTPFLRRKISGLLSLVRLGMTEYSGYMLAAWYVGDMFVIFGDFSEDGGDFLEEEEEEGRTHNGCAKDGGAKRKQCIIYVTFFRVCANIGGGGVALGEKIKAATTAKLCVRMLRKIITEYIVLVLDFFPTIHPPNVLSSTA